MEKKKVKPKNQKHMEEIMLHKKSLFTKVVIAFAALAFAGSANAAPLFSDDYSTDTSANYDTKGDWTFNTADETLDFVVDSSEWVDGYAMVKSSEYSHAADAIVEISGNVTIDDTTDTGAFGLVIANDGTSTSGGLGFFYRASTENWRWMDPTKNKSILGNDGGGYDPFGEGLDGAGTYQLSATLDLATSEGRALVDVEVIYPDGDTTYGQSYDVTYDSNWTEIGWRNRQNGYAEASFDDLTVVPEPVSASLFVLAGGLLWFVRRRVRA